MDNIPNNWKILTLQELLDKNYIISHLDGNHGSLYPRNEEFVDTGVPYLSANCIVNGVLTFSKAKFLSRERALKFSKGIAQNGDVLFAHNATVGPVALLETNEPFVILSTSLTYFRCNIENVLPSFLKHFLLSSYFKNQYLAVMGQATRNQVPITKQRTFKFLIPPLKEQDRIALKLDALFRSIDKSIALLEENINYTLALRSSIIENAFIKLFEHSKTFKIKEIAEIKGGKRLPKGETVLDEKTDYPYIRVTDFNDNGSIDLDNLKYLKKEVQEQIKRYIITSKDLYVSIAGTIGKTGIIPKELDNANLTENAARLVFKSNLKISNRFIYYFTLSNNFKEQVGLATKTVAQPKLALTRLAEVEIPIPSIEMQDKEVKAFDLISSKTNEILKHQHSKLTYLKALKACILDKAFKGEL